MCLITFAGKLLVMDMKTKRLGVLPRLRAAQGKTQRKLAKEAKISQPTLAQIESGRRKARLLTLYKLAAALEVDVELLLEYLDTSAPERGKLGQEARKRRLGR